MRLALAAVVCCLGFSLFACKKDEDEDDKYGKVKIQMANTTPTALVGTEAVSALAVRLKYMRITDGFGGADAGPATSSMIWAAPKCSKTETNEDTGATFGEILSDADSDAAGLSYFDLARSSADVNAELNGQEARVEPGTYTMIGFSLLGEQTGGNNTYENILWEHTASGTGPKRFVSVQAEWFATFSTPLEVAEGETVTVTLSYSLDGTVTTDPTDPVIRTEITQPGAFDDCSNTGAACFTFPTLSLSATK